MKLKKIPLRMCIVCHTMQPKRELIRIVKDKDGNIALDLSGKANGRGAYICKNPECHGALVKKRLLNKVFSANVPAEVYERIGEDFAKK